MRKALTFLSAAVVLTWVAPGMAQQAPDQFKDVEPNHWAYQAMESLRAKGIVIGYPDGYFRGRRTLTRYEFAVALDRALNKIQLTPGPAGPAGEPGAAGAAGEVGPAGKDYDPAELDALKKLTGEFKDELASLGNTVNAVNAKLDALAKDIAALKEAWDKAPKISGRAFFGIRADRAAGNYIDRNGSVFDSNHGTPIFRDPTVVHEFQIGIDAKIAGGATLAAKLNMGNYLGTLDEKFAYDSGYPYGGFGSNSTKNAGNDIWLDQLEIKAPFSGLGRDGSLSIGRFSVHGAKYMLHKPDVDVYLDNPIDNDGKYRVDGLKLTTKFGSLAVEAIGAQFKSVQTTDWEGGINNPLAGNDTDPMDQMVSLSGKLPVRLGEGGYLRLAAMGLTETNHNYSVLVLGADSKVKVSSKLGVDVDWAKSITGNENFTTSPEGADKNNAAEGKVSYDAGKLKVAAGYKYIDPLFLTPGYWDRIGFILNPVNIQGPTASIHYAVSPNLGVMVGGEWLQGVRHGFQWMMAPIQPQDAWNKITAGVHYKLCKSARLYAKWEGDYLRTDTGEGFVHPTLQYVTIGTAYELTSGTTLKLGYEIGDVNGKGLIANFTDGDYPDHFNYNVFTTQVAVKF